MSEYKRLTKHVNGKLVLAKDNASYTEIYYESLLIKEALQRLAELEDKIEAGTLVNVPYAIGQQFYCITKGIDCVDKAKVSLITIKHDGNIDIRLNHYYDDGSYWGCFKYDTKYYELFNTKKEAEAKLKEYIGKANFWRNKK